jgi:predicted branched-subunit amino acid permease
MASPDAASSPDAFPTAPHDPPTASGFVSGFVASLHSILLYVLFGTFVGIGALGHDYGFSLPWMWASTLLVWAGPAQVILISVLGTGGTPLQAALAVTLSAVRLLPMVVSLLPVLRTPKTRVWHLILPAHFTAISLWVDAQRLMPAVPRDRRIPYCNGLGTGYMVAAMTGCTVGFFLAAGLPNAFAAGLLFLTPMVFMMSVMRNARTLVDQLAFGIGLVAGPLLATYRVELDLVWSGLLGGTLGYIIHRWRKAAR